MRRQVCAAGAALSVLATASAPARAEEGMWTFDNFPTARMRDDTGWAPDEAWLNRVMAASARLPACSASVVSGAGLVLTNHHCVIACLQSLSSADSDYLAEGYMARVRADEARCTGMFMDVLVSVRDVTSRIDAAAAAAGEGAAFAAVRDGEIARIEGECAGAGRRCEVVTLYDGGRYTLHAYRRFEDVRIVFAPEHAMAAYGGAADNFRFPRFSTDFAFLRLYEGGAPAATPQHLPLRFTPPQDGEVVLASGNPGATSRFRAVSEMAYERDLHLPWRIETMTRVRDRLRAYAAQGPDQARRATSMLQTVENAIQVLQGRRAALANPEGFAAAGARERDLRARISRNLAAQRDVGEAWAEIETAQRRYRGMFHAHQYLEALAGEGSYLFAWARDIVRAADERARPDGERLPRYTEARIGAVRRGVASTYAVDPAMEEIFLSVWLDGLRTHLARNPAIVRALGAETPAALAARLAQSRLADPAFRLALWEGGQAAVAASDDPMIVLVRAIDADARVVRARYETEVEGPAALADERIARARFRAFETSQYPAATFTPRLSYGRVAGWREADGAQIGPFSTIGALYERAASGPALAPSWADARGRLDMSAVLTLVTTNDITNGNSGSPLIDREGRVVGLVFDGNTHVLGGEFYFDGARNRAISLSVSAIHAALVNVYGMDGLVDELAGR